MSERHGGDRPEPMGVPEQHDDERAGEERAEGKE